jgi:hypothetical protein
MLTSEPHRLSGAALPRAGRCPTPATVRPRIGAPEPPPDLTLGAASATTGDVASASQHLTARHPTSTITCDAPPPLPRATPRPYREKEINE